MEYGCGLQSTVVQKVVYGIKSIVTFFMWGGISFKLKKWFCFEAKK